ncbi:MAG: Rne/Rng family ribonuclease, partial [Rhodospirillaceae bacterium]
LVQVVKEERGNKGAALTTYISLAGRYCVLMPNSSRGGGISRKITSAQERRKLRDTLNALDIPQGMGVIIRTAGLERSKAEIRRDFEYLLRAWDEVREVTLESTAPSMVYEEGNIIKRAIRDVYSKDIDEILVDGNETYQTAKRFMRLMMPSHAKRVQPYRDETVPLFQRFQIEQQLDAMHNPEVQLKSGGYIVINPTEALVAIDVNSGKSTRERNIEETALKTNLEAADEVARQLRLRDLAGLIVIDFIDMEDSRNVRKVERRLREAMKVDRARLQIGRISNFGLLELSRQRLRPSLLETSTQICPHCRGTGHILSTESMAMRVLRAIEEEGIRMRSSEITVRVPTVVALYILNQKRATLVEMEARYGFGVILQGDDSVIPPDVEIERVKGRPEPVPSLQARSVPIEIEDDADDDIEDDIEDEVEEKAEDDGKERVSAEEETAEKAQKRGRRRRGRRRGRDEQPRTETGEAGMPAGDAAEAAAEAPEADADSDVSGDGAAAEGGEGDEDKPRRRRRGRRGGRRRGRSAGDADSPTEDPDAPDAPETGGGDDMPATEEYREPLAAMTDAAEAPAVGEPAEPDAVREPAEPDAEIEVREENIAETVAAALSEEPAPAQDEPHPEADDAEDDEPAAQRPAMTEREPEPVSRSPAAPQGEFADTAVEDRPKRKGWWQRIVE